MTSMKALFGAALMSAILLSSDARAALVTNGGFETGDFTGWTQGGNTGFTGVGLGIGHSGSYGAFFGPAGSNGTISQSIITTPGQTYEVSFFLLPDGSQNFFSASFAGFTGVSLTNPAAAPYTQFTFLAQASSATSSLIFTFRDEVGFLHLDDIAVDQAAVPVPAVGAGLPLLLAGGGLLAWWRRRQKSSLNFPRNTHGQTFPLSGFMHPLLRCFLDGVAPSDAGKAA